MPRLRRLGGTNTPALDVDHGLVADHDASGVGLFEAGDAAQRGGLAAAGRAEQRHHLAGTDLEIDAGDGCDHLLVGGEILGQPLDADHQYCSCTPKRRPTSQAITESTASSRNIRTPKALSRRNEPSSHRSKMTTAAVRFCERASISAMVNSR